MRDVMSVSARMIALALGVAFIVSAAFVLLAFNLERQAFNPQAYKRALLEERVYDRLPALISGQLSSTLASQPPGSEGVMPPYFRNLTQPDWEIILSALVTPEWLQAQAEGVVDQVFVYLNSADPAPAIRISMAEIKIRLQGEPGRRAFEQMLSAQPACTESQLLEIAQAAIFGNLEDLPLCQPPEGLLDEFQPEIQAALGEFATGIPNEIDLGSQFMSASGDPRPGLRRIRLLIRFSPLLPAILLLGVTIFAVRSLRDGLLWWGTLLLLAGLAALALAFLSSPLISQALSAMLLGGGGLPVALMQEVELVGQAVVHAAIRSTAVQAGVLALVGLGMALVGLLISPRTGFGY